MFPVWTKSAKFLFTHSKTRKQHFAEKLLGKYQISKPTGNLGTSCPLPSDAQHDAIYWTISENL